MLTRYDPDCGVSGQFRRTEKRPGGSTVQVTRKRCPSWVSKARRNVKPVAGANGSDDDWHGLIGDAPTIELVALARDGDRVGG